MQALMRYEGREELHHSWRQSITRDGG